MSVLAVSHSDMMDNFEDHLLSQILEFTDYAGQEEIQI